MHLFRVILLSLLAACAPVYSDTIQDKPPFEAIVRVICDGKGDYTLRWLHVPINQIEYRCLLEHEHDHLRYLRKYYPKECKYKKWGEELFQLNGGQLELSYIECRGYKKQAECLRRAGQHAYSQRILDYAEEEFECKIWEKYNIEDIEEMFMLNKPERG